MYCLRFSIVIHSADYDLWYLLWGDSVQGDTESGDTREKTRIEKKATYWKNVMYWRFDVYGMYSTNKLIEVTSWNLIEVIY